MNGSTIAVGIAGLVIGGLIGMYALAPDDAAQDMGAPGETMAEAPAAPTPGPQVRWKMASSFPGEMVQLGDQGHMIEERVRVLSSGTMEFKFFEPGRAGAGAGGLRRSVGRLGGRRLDGRRLLGRENSRRAVLHRGALRPLGGRGGRLDVLRRRPAIAGRALSRPQHPRDAVQPDFAEGSGWFREPIESIDDLKGLKMRFFGLGAKVMEKLGVSTQLLAAGDIYPALELGTIDATEFSMPAIDRDLGFHEIAKHYYFPGWHQPISMGELIINLDNWDGLTDTQREIVNAVCKESMLRGLAQGEAIQFGAMQELQAQGVTFHRWSPEILAALEEAWYEVADEISADDADFARVWASLQSFRENYKLWGDLGYLD